MLSSGVMPTPPAISTTGRSSFAGYRNAPAGALSGTCAPGRSVACSVFETSPWRLTDLE
jgi:hypothetical protein